MAAWLVIAPPAAALALLVLGESRPAIPPTAAARLHAGMTEADVRGLLGTPRHILPRRDGSRHWIYSGGTPSRHHVEFGPDGKMGRHWEDR